MSSGIRIHWGIGDVDVLSSGRRFHFRGICWGDFRGIYTARFFFVILLHLSFSRLFKAFVFFLLCPSRRWLGSFLRTNTHLQDDAGCSASL